MTGIVHGRPGAWLDNKVTERLVRRHRSQVFSAAVSLVTFAVLLVAAGGAIGGSSWWPWVGLAVAAAATVFLGYELRQNRDTHASLMRANQAKQAEETFAETLESDVDAVGVFHSIAHPDLNRGIPHIVVTDTAVVAVFHSAVAGETVVEGNRMWVGDTDVRRRIRRACDTATQAATVAGLDHVAVVLVTETVTAGVHVFPGDVPVEWAATVNRQWIGEAVDSVTVMDAGVDAAKKVKEAFWAA